MFVAMWSQTHVDEGRRQQTPPLTDQDQVGVRGSIMDQLSGGRILGRDAVKDHPAEDSNVDGQQNVRARGGENVPAALTGVRP